MPTRIYLDHNATTPLDPEVMEEMAACLQGAPGNPSSIHSFGQDARRVIVKARLRVARLIGAQPEEIIFTSGGTEADNLAVLGTAAAAKRDRPHVVTTAIEHQAVLNPCRHIERSGGSVTFLGVDREGLVDPADAAAALRDDTVLASIMLANNDVGAIQPVAAISPAVRERSILFHTDAVQAVGKLPVDVRSLGVDLLSFSGHKLQGPQGAGALFVRNGVALSPRSFGGHQERGLRPGTENVAAIAGFGKACELAAKRLEEDAARLAALRSSFEKAILDRIPGTAINAGGAPRLPNTANIAFEGLEGEFLAFNLDLLGVAVSTAAACSSADREPSHVLIAMGRTPEQASSSIRVSFGRGNTYEDVSRAVDLVAQAVEGMRGGPR
ncbi:MAG: cysteine desulfurase [Deltaproteobacteria bacterium]|nr:cysteine desulfurase [Deltaproteobacteria bacterium]